MVLEDNLSLVKKVNRLLNWGHWFSFFNILIALGVTSIYWLSEPAPVSVLGGLYMILNWIGHTAFLCFMFFILSVFPISLVFPYQRHVRGLAAFIATSGLIVLIFDAYVYASLGYHIGSASLDQTIELLRQQIVTNLRNFVLIVCAVGTILLAVELTISNYCWKKIERLKQSGIANPLFLLFVSSFMLSHLLHIYADANLKYDITKQDNVLPLSYPATAKTFLARYQLVDLNTRALKQLDKLSFPDEFGTESALFCSNSKAGDSTIIVVSNSISPIWYKSFYDKGLKPLEQHFAPRRTEEALLHLLYGQFSIDQSLQQRLVIAPTWLQQVDEGQINITFTEGTELVLPWLTEQPSAKFSIVFDDTPIEHWARYQSYTNIVVLSLAGSQQQFNLTPAQAWTNWAALRKLQNHQVTQHLDWLPTLLAQAGCNSAIPWLGDNLKSPSSLPKLAISGQEIISFKKDKMVILRADGSYGVWSAGTLVPLNDKLDLPMLTDALKRIETRQD